MKSIEQIREYKAKWAKEKRKDAAYLELKNAKAREKTASFNKTVSRNKRDLTGERFGRLTVVSLYEIKNNRIFWICKCDCGEERNINNSSLRRGSTQSCGCLKTEKFRTRSTIHGDRETREYSAWRSMKSRCYNKKYDGYYNYGGRGIIVCDRWLNSYSNFLEDMGRCPSPELSLDRKDTDGNYEKNNCRWATVEVQSNNKRTCRYITYKEKTLTISQWERELKLNRGRFSKKRFNGWPKENIVEFFYKQIPQTA